MKNLLPREEVVADLRSDYAWDFDEYSYGCGQRTRGRVSIWVSCIIHVNLRTKR